MGMFYLRTKFAKTRSMIPKPASMTSRSLKPAGYGAAGYASLLRVTRYTVAKDMDF